MTERRIGGTTKPPARRRRAGGLIAAGLVLFMAFVIYRSFHVSGYKCAVCITFRGQSVCRTVEGASEHDARMAATTNACAYLASGVTDSLACERTAPTRVDCTAVN
jgi:hypothetical protein